MLSTSVPQFRKRPAKPRASAPAPSPPPPPPPPPPPVALELVSAEYATEPARVRLVFERAIDIAALDGSQIVVTDAELGVQYVGNGPAGLFDPTTIDIELVETGSYFGEYVHLTATAMTGIVAVDDGGTWAGAVDLLLPFA